MATGSFAINGRVGIDIDGNEVQNLVELAKSFGVATGLVTTTRLAHATPASFASHVNSRSQYQDIALQMAQLRPRVMLGGGRADFEVRADNQNLAETLAGAGYEVVRDATELAA
jgi:alkaline phosphatase